MQDKKKIHSGVEATIKVIGPKWTVFIIKELMEGTRRFGQLEKALTGISPRTLSLRLAHMERVGVLERKVFPEVPPRVEYKLTAAGRALDPIMKAMQQWGSSSVSKKK
jgi:DNA-binding HxlR family transcriptional regulator